MQAYAFQTGQEWAVVDVSSVSIDLRCEGNLEWMISA